MNGSRILFKLYMLPYTRVVRREMDLGDIGKDDVVLNVGCGSMPFTAALITDLTGGDGYVALVDQRLAARNDMLAPACGAADGKNIERDARSVREEPRHPQLELCRGDDGDPVEPTGRVNVPTGLGRQQHVVFLDGRFVGSATTIDDAKAVLGHTLSPSHNPRASSGPRAPTLRSEGGARGSSLDVHMARPSR